MRNAECFLSRVGLVQGDKIYSLYSIKIIMSMESPHKDSKPDMCVCVHVCVC